MAMTILHSAGIQLSLGELNKNTSRLGKSLSKISTGQRIVNAAGDAASFAISERMREKIRSLMQDTQNVQNGSSIIRTAERGIDQIIQNMRTMKELAIDAANDSNTDEDRAIIQKEFNALRDTINDIAIGTQYNGKILLDGRWSGGVWPLQNGSGGMNTSVKNISDCFSAGKNAEEVSAGSSNGGYGDWTFETDKAFGAEDRTKPFSVEMDFSDMEVEGSYPTGLHGQVLNLLR